MSLPVPSPRTSGKGFGFIIIGKSLIIIGFKMTLRSFWSSVYKISPPPLASFEMAQDIGFEYNSSFILVQRL